MNKLTLLKLISATNNETLEFVLNSNLRLPLSAYSSTRDCEIVETVQLGSPDWKIILDESFRSVKSKGTVKFKVREYKGSDLRDLLIFLGANSPERDCQLISFEKVGIFLYEFAVEVTRKIEIRESWSVCYITGGSSLEQINKTARNLVNCDDIEILVTGPKSISAKIEKNIKFIEFVDEGRSARISLKKNVLASHAKGSNLLLLHDRYLVDTDFFEAFAKFGYDYGVVAPKQLFAESQKAYPGMLTFEGPLIKRIDIEIIDEKMWVNGGCIVVKKEIFEKISLNSFLSWGEAEDIEWAQRLLLSGVTPRISNEATLLTVDTPSAAVDSIGIFSPKFGVPDLFSDLKCLAIKGDKIFFDQVLPLLSSYNLTSSRRSKLGRLIRKVNKWQSKENEFINITANRFVVIFYLALLITRRKSQKNSSVIRCLKNSKDVIFRESMRKRYLVMAYLVMTFIFV